MMNKKLPDYQSQRILLSWFLPLVSFITFTLFWSNATY